LNVDVKEHVRTLTDALTNLSPSRNLISQFILLLPKASSIVEHSYPEITSSAEAKSLMKQHLGVEFGDMVKRASNSFFEALYEQIHKIFDQLADEEIRSGLAKLSNVAFNSIPNPYAEWVKLVLKKLSTRPDGSKIIDFLRMLVERGSFIVSREGYSRSASQTDWQPFLEEARKSIKANPAEFDEILKLTVQSSESPEEERISESRSVGVSYTTTTTYLKHSEYHLDLLSHIRTSTQINSHYWVDDTYEVRHKGLVKAVLQEVQI